MKIKEERKGSVGRTDFINPQYIEADVVELEGSEFHREKWGLFVLTSGGAFVALIAGATMGKHLNCKLNRRTKYEEHARAFYSVSYTFVRSESGSARAVTVPDNEGDSCRRNRRRRFKFQTIFAQISDQESIGN